MRASSLPTKDASTLASVSEPITAVYSVNSSIIGSCVRITPASIPACRNSIARTRSGSSAAPNRSNAFGPRRPASRMNIGNSGHSAASA